MEMILPSKYVLNESTEISSFPGVAYKTERGVKTELIWGTHPLISVALVDKRTEIDTLIISHVFVERYISTYIKQDIMNVEIFKIHFNKGDFPEKPDGMRGDIISNFKDNKLDDIWMSYEHVHGPYLADTNYIASHMREKRLEEIGAKILVDLIPERDNYMENPLDLPQIGIIMNGSDDSQFDYIHNLVQRDRSIKEWLN